ncbi:hypothetical protein NP233_g1744 [Leucocoprinus birnbaumii]|uniref:Cytochrome P450 n=1 Tax=Leucocoprinus birnbaumii TaxID=56174 RepID=A0AAD5W0D0_9AGAR|nr:hypothetical protein NP233_g1744 [Leucocoprinus birnbaumii]
MSNMALGLVMCFIATAIASIRHSRDKWLRRSGLPLPPGPRPLPLVGNLFDQPQETPWLTYLSWSKQYGSDIVSIDVLGRTTVVLNSAKAISDLLERRSVIYSSRVRFPMLNELIGWSWNFAFMAYGQRWRERRRIFTRHFSPSAIKWLHPVHTKHSRKLLHQLLHSPSEFQSHLRHNQTASILESVYGTEIKGTQDPFYRIAEISMLSLSTAGVFGTFYVDFLPILKHLPSWLPGAGFRNLRQKMLKNEAKSCIGKNMLENNDSEDDETSLQVIRDALGIAFGAGADTSVATSLVFVLAMILYPECQCKAQAEIDAVVGRNRLPDFTDQSKLPYVNALCKEVLRWQNVTPLSVAHATSEDDVYAGFFIPKGSVIVPNTWAVTHDPETYAEPAKFDPDRFLSNGCIDPNVKDPQAYTFGSGRRICPGRFFALDSLYCNVTNILACFSIEPTPDGKLVDVPRMLNGVISFPEEYDVIMKPRYLGVEDLIEGALAQEVVDL